MTQAARRFQNDLQDTGHKAKSWANSLKLKQAALDLLVLPFYAISWFFGILWFGLKYLAGILVVGFKKGSRSDNV